MCYFLTCTNYITYFLKITPISRQFFLILFLQYILNCFSFLRNFFLINLNHLFFFTLLKIFYGPFCLSAFFTIVIILYIFV
nr:MAG TPA: hypothetical protein [Caudoviricetes sp.]